MAIPNQVIQEIMDKVDIVDVVSRYVHLKKSGSSIVGLCPFHNEKTPSFHVSPDKQLYYCFGCQNGGTVINFIMNIENLDFVEAVKLLGEQAGVNVPDEKEFDNAKAQKKKRLYLANAEAGRFFYHCLAQDQAKGARQYLAGRGLSSQTIARFGVGFAPNTWDSLIKHLKSKGFQEEEILDAGLASKSSKNSVFDRFRNRIMFPILDIRGNVIGFGGRVMDDSLPKYLNTSDTMIFDKSANLFGLNIAKKSSQQRLIVVEGYMDVITLHQNGVDTAVASLGTAFTEQQAKLVKRYAQEIILCYDGDGAGKKAAGRALGILNEAGIKTKVITLQGAKDPDEYCKKFGVSKFLETIEHAETPVLYKIGILKAKYDLKVPDQKISFLNDVAQELVKLPNEIEREIYGKEIALEAGVSYEAVQSQVKKQLAVLKKKRQQKEKIEAIKDLNQKTIVKDGTSSLLQETEAKLLSLMFYDRKAFQRIVSRFDPLDFTEELHQQIAQKIIQLRTDKAELREMDLISLFDIEKAGAISGVLNSKTYFEDSLQAADELMETIQQFRRNGNVIELAKSGNLEKAKELLQRKTRKGQRKE